MPKPRPAVYPLREDVSLDETLYAVNLLDRARPWAYDLYNLLAFPVVRGVGARPLLKGIDGERVAGEGEARETILIVAYQGSSSFLRLASHPWFVLISMLRRLGLRSFRFGFTRRLDAGPLPPERPRGRRGHLLALFWPQDAELDLDALLRRVSAAGSTLVFAGSTTATLAIDRGDGRGPRPTRQAPPLDHGHVAVAFGHERTLEPLASELPEGATLAVRYRRLF